MFVSWRFLENPVATGKPTFGWPRTECTPPHPRKSWKEIGRRAMDSQRNPSIMTNRNTSPFPPGTSALHDKTHDKFFPIVAFQCQDSTGYSLQTPLSPRHLCIPAKSEHGLSALKTFLPRDLARWARLQCGRAVGPELWVVGPLNRCLRFEDSAANEPARLAFGGWDQ